MFLSALLASLFGIAFLSIGHLAFRFIRLEVESPLKIEVIRLTGLAFALGISGIVFSLNIPSSTLVLILGFMVLAGLPSVSLRRDHLKADQLATFVRVRVGAWIAAVFYTFLMQPTFGSRWSFRTGPDSFGWSGAALAVCRGDTSETLTQRVMAQLDGTPLLASFARPVKTGDTSITQISSFTDQVAAEFLLGAHRTGLPTLLGGLCDVTSERFYGHLFVGFAALTVFSVTRIIRLIARESGLRPITADLVSVAAIASVAPLSVTLEGGYGQLVTLPFFVLAVASLQKKRFSGDLLFLSLVLLFVAALSSYLDLVYLAIPLLGGIFVLGLIFKTYDPLTIDIRKSLVAIFAILLTLPMLGEVPRLAMNAGPSARLSGWHQGRVILPDNLFGVLSSLPSGTYQIEPRSFYLTLIELLISAGLLALVLVAPLRQRLLGGFLLLGYFYLTYSVYSDALALNNYRIWKYSAYAAVLFSFILVGVIAKFQQPTRGFSSGHERWSSRLVRGFVHIVLAASLVSSIGYSSDWLDSKSLTASAGDASLMRKLTKDYDLVFGPGLYPAMYTLYGDLSFGALNRGGEGIGNVSRDLARPLAVVVEVSTVPSLQTFNAVADGGKYSSYTEIARGDSIKVYLLSRN